ncbi:AAA family ATPase [Bacillus hwajinpoensis]|uniref:Shikimate kinase n=1 Tax=Guptibacillus hwajinpoensis TaxID=208199 RepID=A0A845EX50_9BACL|nr:shikimate kinase [Pseudalkalibacillus hwajinpoensis]MYL63130.1 AAA family ATPase [Pseudalkalibacillus hwajinpoensis]
MKAIYLTGFMGSGKTTVAEELSKALALPSEDTDKHVTKMQGREIPVIFESEGEKAFRSYETASLKDLPTENIIISTGGGIVLSEENRSFMKKNGTMIYLHCDPEEIIKRLEGDTSRPLLAGDNKQDKINTIFTERLPLYREANYEIETTNRSVKDIVAEICQRIG